MTTQLRVLLMFWKAIADAAFTTYDLSLAIAWKETSQESFEDEC